MGLNAVQVLRAPALLVSYLSRCTVSCAFALIRTCQLALRSVVSSSAETGATSSQSYICMHSVSLACASCMGVFSEALRSFMRIHFDCRYAARLEVCVLKFITDRCDLPTELCVRAQCVLRAPTVLESYVSHCPVACAYALIVTMMRALRSVVSSSSETGGTFPPRYMCIHSVCLAPTSCTTVFSQLIHTLKGMYVRYHCLFPLKGHLNVSFGARQHVPNRYLKQIMESVIHTFSPVILCVEHGVNAFV